MRGTHSDERLGHLQLLLALTRAVILRSKSCRTHDQISLSQIRDPANLEGQVPVFISCRNRVAQLYPKALGSLFVASYNSQGYSGGIRTRLHVGNWSWLQHLSTHHAENVSSIIALFFRCCGNIVVCGAIT
jgi:hypothetical protein